MDMSLFLKRVVSITLFNKGQASRQLKRVQDEGALVVIKNNTPIAVIVSPEEYVTLRLLSRKCKKEIAINGVVSSDKISKLIKQIDAYDERDELNV